MKTAIITGAGGLIGTALTEAFLGGQWKVIGTGRSKRPDSFPEHAEYFSFDASKPDQTQTFWRDLKPDAEQTCLINNAGSWLFAPFVEQPANAFVEAIENCYYTAVNMTQGLLETHASARIVNIISTSALEGFPGESSYGAAKAAMAHVFDSLRAELKDERFTITNVFPDYVSLEHIVPDELAAFVQLIASMDQSMLVKDVTLLPRKRTSPSPT